MLVIYNVKDANL